MMPIFESVQAIPPMDLVWKFEHDLLSSQVTVHTNTEKRGKKAKIDTAKINRAVENDLWYLVYTTAVL